MAYFSLIAFCKKLLPRLSKLPQPQAIVMFISGKLHTSSIYPCLIFQNSNAIKAAEKKKEDKIKSPYNVCCVVAGLV